MSPSTENTYAPVPSSSPPSSPRSSTSTLPPSSARRANRPPPPPSTSFERPHVPSYQRALLLAFIAILFYLAFHLGGLGDPRAGSTSGGKLHDGRAKFNEGLKERYGADVVHAKRYSPEFKYRPAASPVIKERLKDGSGKIRLRGANPGGVV